MKCVAMKCVLILKLQNYTSPSSMFSEAQHNNLLCIN